MINYIGIIVGFALLIYVVWISTYIAIKAKYDDKSKVEYRYKSRTKVAIWFKWMFYSKLIISILFAIFIPEWIKYYYQSFLFDTIALMYIHSYSKGDLKKLSEHIKKKAELGRLKRQAKKDGKV